jgi:branched-chain amino acid transport system permease protein
LVAGLAVAAGALVLWSGTARAQEPPTTAAPPTTQPGAGNGAAVQGTLSYDEDDKTVPAEGVSITVKSADGGFDQTVETDADGKYRVDLPAAGDYSVTLDTDTLPKGVKLEDSGRTSLTLTFEEGRVRPALFPLTTGSGGGGSGDTFVKKFLRLSIEGIRFGLVIAVCAIGLSLIFGTTGLVNFAHGEMVTFGALVAYWFNQTLGWPLLVGAPLAMVAGALLGGGLDLGLWRPLRARGTGLVAMLVISIGVGILLRNIFQYQFGAAARPLRDFQLQKGIEVGPVTMVPRDIVIIALSVVLLIGVASFLQFTRVGKAMRAVSDDRDLAESSGIDVERIILFVWMVGGALAALGGIFQALDQQASFQFGFQLLLLMFAAVTLGGLGTAYGALVGSLVIGLFTQLSTLVIGTEFKTAAALGVLILVLVVRPQGILGQAERVG